MAESSNVQEWKSILVDRVKRLQRSSHEVKLEWYAHCKTSGSAHFDPNRYDPDFLLSFLGKYQPGSHSVGSQGSQASAEPPAGAGVAPEMEAPPRRLPNPGGKHYVIEKVKDIQRSAPENRKCWYAFCQSQCTSNYDPARHDEVFLRKFIEVYESGRLGGTPAGSAAGKGGKSGGGSGWGEWDSGGGWWSGEATQWDGGGGDWSSSSGWGDGGSGCSGSSTPQMVAPAAFMAMMKGKTAMLKGMDPQEAAALGKGFFAAMMEKGGMTGKGPGPDTLGSAVRSVGTGSMACGGGVPGVPSSAFSGANNKTVSLSTRNLSEFGILDVPLDEARLNAKRGFASVSVEPGIGGGLMTEEEAREFQKSLRKR